MNDLISIIMPAFNRASLIGLALDSVLKQTYDRWEAIVIDDDSSDDTIHVVEEYSRKDCRIRLIRHPERKGAPAARNTGIRAAKGAWITFVDSDDRLLPDSLEIRLRLALEMRLEVVHSDCLVVKSESTKLERMGVRPIHGRVYKKLLRGPATNGYFLFSKEALTRIGPLDETLVSYQDWDIAVRLAKYYAFGFVDKPTFIWDCRSADTISSGLLQKAKGYEQVFKKHRWSILRHLGPKALLRHYERAADFYFQAKDEDNARCCLMKAFLLWPFRPRTILRGIHRVLRS